MLKHAFNRLWSSTAAALTALSLATVALAAQTITVVQKDREFQTTDIAIAAGDTIRFTNEDEFLHQIYTNNSAEFSFDTDEQASGDVVEVEFPVAGSYEVRCGIHPRMVLNVEVE